MSTLRVRGDRGKREATHPSSLIPHVSSMCGIAGFLNLNGGGNADSMREIAQRMANTIRHRGPDDDGTFVDADAGIAFGFRRLAIIDLTDAGAQPMTSASGRYVINFNGEVYNHAELRAHLGDVALRGHPQFDATIDPEAVTSYARYGYVGGPRSIYSCAKKVEPGTIVRNDTSEIYWDPIAIAQRVHNTFRGDEREACDELNSRLIE